jgi:hypothetical protein
MVVVGDRIIEAEFEAAARKVGPAIKATTTMYGQLMLNQIRANASGRPGPNVITGDYRRSWQLTTRGRGNSQAESEVWTNAPQFLRLEYGFHGVDSLGRHYDQPPFPHVAPAVDQIAPLYYAALGVVVERLLP